MNLERRLEKLEAVITERQQVDPVDLSRLNGDELRTLEVLAEKAQGGADVWTLDKLAVGELRTLRALVDKARGSTGERE